MVKSEGISTVMNATMRFFARDKSRLYRIMERSTLTNVP